MAALPAVALPGDKRLSCGTGLFTVKLTTVVGFPPGFETATRKLPAAAIALAGMFACNWATLKKVEGMGSPLNVTTEF